MFWKYPLNHLCVSAVPVIKPTLAIIDSCAEFCCKVQNLGGIGSGISKYFCGTLAEHEGAQAN